MYNDLEWHKNPQAKENYSVVQDKIKMTAKLYETALNNGFLQNT